MKEVKRIRTDKIDFIPMPNGGPSLMLSTYDDITGKCYLVCHDGLIEQNQFCSTIIGDPIPFSLKSFCEMLKDRGPSQRDTEGAEAKQKHLDDMREIARGLVQSLNKEKHNDK